MISLPILMEILQCIQYVGSILDFIKNNEGGPFGNGEPYNELKIIQNPGNIFGRCEELQVFRMFVKIKIGDLFILSTTKLFKQPGLPYLPNPLENERLAIGGLLPSDLRLHCV